MKIELTAAGAIRAVAAAIGIIGTDDHIVVCDFFLFYLFETIMPEACKLQRVLRRKVLRPDNSRELSKGALTRACGKSSTFVLSQI